MDIKNENEKLIRFWNTFFEKTEPMEITKDDLPINQDINRLLKYVGDHSLTVVDIGCGWGYGLITAKLLGDKMQKGIGIDPSEQAIDILQKTCTKSKINGLEGIVGTHSELERFYPSEFDGVICSNVLDVVPYETSLDIISQIKRVLKPGGLCLLKFNFYLTDEIIQRIKMEKIDTNTYTINGVIRGLNYTTDTWINRFNDFEVIELAEYERISQGPKDRLLLLKKSR